MYEGLKLAAQRGAQRFAGTPPPVAARPAAAASAPKAATPTPAVSAGISKAERDNAVASAIANERARMAEVFASPASKGRERLAAKMLGGTSTMSAAQIVATLATMPTDAEAAGEANNHGWDKIYAELRREGRV